MRISDPAAPDSSLELGFGRDYQAQLAELAPVLSSERITKYCHDAKLNTAALALRDVPLRGVAFDTMLAAYLLDSTRGSFAIGDIAFEHLSLELPGVTTRKDQVEVDDVAMICGEAEVIYRVKPPLEAKLKDQEALDLYTDVELPLAPILAQMELTGVAVDAQQLEAMSATLEVDIKNIEREVHELAGEQFNIGSTKQLRTILFDKLGLQSAKKTKTGYSTSASALEALAEQHPIVELILRYRELTKIKSTYADALPRLISPATHRIHTSLNQAVTATGRLSSSDPNLQNIPIRSELGRGIRKAFVASGDNVLLSADHSQIELRVLAHLSADRELVRAFENNEPSYARLMDAVREKTDCICMWGPQSNHKVFCSSHPVDIDVEEERVGDTTILRRTLHTPKGDLTNTSKIIDNVHTVWQTEHWCKDLDDVERALSVPYEPLVYDPSDYTRICEEVGDHGIIMDGAADALCVVAELMEFGAFTVWAMSETDHFARTMDAIHERNMENLRRALDANVADLYRICGPEYMTPPYLPPVFFERFVVPYVKEMVDLIHGRGSLVRLHCHGKIGQVLDCMIETGADAIDPCEAPPDGDIELADLKRRAGDRLCLCGNLELKLLELGSTEDVRRTVIDCMEAAKHDGGYIILPTAAPINVPLAKKSEENYLTFIDTALEHGAY